MTKGTGNLMSRVAAWLASNAEALIALVLAIVVSLLSAFDKAPESLISSATLAVLALVGFAIVRDRWHRESSEQAIRTAVTAANSTFQSLDHHLAVVSRLDELTTAARHSIEEMAATRVLTGAEVSNALSEARKATDRWVFKGGTGTYIRAVTLPQCVENARRERRALLVRLEIIDPTNEELCARYARLRQSLARGPDGTGETWTPERTRKEAYATIVAACWYRSQFQLLDIDVGLASTMTTLRFDLSAQGLIITQEDSRAPALYFASGRFLYECFSTELRTSLEQARRVPLERTADVLISDTPTVAEVRNLLHALEIELPQEYSDDDVAEIITKALNAKNPYA